MTGSHGKGMNLWVRLKSTVGAIIDISALE